MKRSFHPSGVSSAHSLRKPGQPSSFHPLELNPDCSLAKKQRRPNHSALSSTRLREASPRIRLTRKALRALEEQNARLPVSVLSTDTLTRARSLPSRPRSIVSVQPQPTAPVIDSAFPTSASDVEAFARHGGPDSADIRGVGTVPRSKCQILMPSSTTYPNTHGTKWTPNTAQLTGGSWNPS